VLWFLTVLGRSLKRLVSWLCGFVVLAGIGYSIAYLRFNDEVLGSFISGQVTRSVRGTFSLGRVHYSFWGGLYSVLTGGGTDVVGERFEMLDSDGHVVMKVPQVLARAHLRELCLSLGKFALTRRFHLRLHFSDVEIPNAFAVIAPTSASWSGRQPVVNIVDAMSSRRQTPSDGGELSIQVDKARLAHVDFALGFPDKEGHLGWFGRVDDAAAEAGLVYSSSSQRATADGPFFFFNVKPIKAERGLLQLGSFRFPLESFTGLEFGAAGGRRQDLAFRVRTRTLGADIAAEGALTDVYSDHSGVRLDLRFHHGNRLPSLLPQPVASWLSGDADGALHIGGQFRSGIEITGDAHGFDFNLDGLEITHGAAHLSIDSGDDGVIHLDPTVGQLGRGKIKAGIDVKLSPPASFRVRAELAGVDPMKVPQLRRAGSVLAGRLAGTLQISGRLSEPAAPIRVQAKMLRLDRAHPGQLPKHVELDGVVLLQPSGRLTLDKVVARGDGAALTADGTFDPRSQRVEAAVKLEAGAGPWLEHLGAPPAVKVGGLVAHGHVDGPLPRLEGKAHFLASHLTLAGRLFQTLEGDVSLRGGVLRLEDVSGTGLGATLRGRGEVALFSPSKDGRGDLGRLLEEPRLQAELEAAGANLSEVLGAPQIVGKAAVALLLDGTLAHPRGSARLSIPQLIIGGDPYEEGRLAFEFGEEGAKVRDLHLRRRSGGTVTGTGKVGWNGSLELQLKPRSFPLAAIPGVASLPVPLHGTLSGDVSIGGDLSRPQPGGVISLIGARVRDTFFGDGTLRLVPGTDAIAISGRFFNSFSIDGYLTLFPKISVAATIRFRDLELERIFPEMKKLAEVKGKASGEARISYDSDAGLTYAGLRLSAVSLDLSGLDEEGHGRHLVVSSDGEVVVSTDGQKLRVERCHLRSQLGAFSIEGAIAQRGSDVRLRGEIGLELLEYFFRGLFEHTHGDATVDLAISGNLDRPDVTGSIDLRQARLVPRALEHHLLVPRGRVEVTPTRVTLRGLDVNLDGVIAHASGSMAIDHWVPGALIAEVTGDLSPKFLQWFFPDQIGDASGALGVDVHLGGTWSNLEWQGRATVKDVHVGLRMGRELVLSEGTIFFQRSDLVFGCGGTRPQGCRRLSGNIDEQSPIGFDGRLSFGGGFSLKKVDLSFEGTEIYFSTREYSLAFSPRLHLIGDGRRLALSGDLNLVEGRYHRDFSLLDYVVLQPRSVERDEPFWKGMPLWENLDLDIRAKSTGSLGVKNNIADLKLSASLHIGGTLEEPSLSGSLQVEPQGTLNLPGSRIQFQSERSQVDFTAGKSIPSETPRLDLHATGELVDSRDDSLTHVINLGVTGLLPKLNVVLSSQEGWDQKQVLLAMFSGRANSNISNTGEGAARTASGAVVSQIISDPLAKVARLDTLSIEFGTAGVDVRACKKVAGRGLKFCGQGEIGFASGSRVGGSLELKLMDWLSGQGRVEYITRGVETQQDSLTRGKLELNLRLPLFH
jgi:autotransporter translocation and assembly factor TamB